MGEVIFGVIVMFLLGGLPCIVIGYLIAYKDRVDLIAGWDEKRVNNPVAYGKILGTSLIILGVGLSFQPVLWVLSLVPVPAMVVIFIFLVLIPIFAVIYLNIKYGN